MENLVHTFETAICRAPFSLVYTGLSCIVIGGTTWNIWCCTNFEHGFLIWVLNWFPHCIDKICLPRYSKKTSCAKNEIIWCFESMDLLYTTLNFIWGNELLVFNNQYNDIAIPYMFYKTLLCQFIGISVKNETLCISRK